jgi:hypothetical protein
MERVRYSQDEDLLAEATRRRRSGEPCGGASYAHQLLVTISEGDE